MMKSTFRVDYKEELEAAEFEEYCLSKKINGINKSILLAKSKFTESEPNFYIFQLMIIFFCEFIPN